MRRYLPITQRLTILEFGNKFFTKNGKVLKPDDIDMNTQYPLGWDDLHDRDVVWTTTPNMINDFIKGIENFTVINPFSILDLGSNIETLDKVENREDINYWTTQKKKNDFFVFVGKNRTLTAIYKVWLSLIKGESTYDHIKDYIIEYKLFDKNFTLQWKGEIYRGEKTQYDDSEIMMLVSYPCQIGTWIYNYVKGLAGFDKDGKEKEKNLNKGKLDILKNIFSNDSIIKYEHRALIFDLMRYVKNRTLKSTKKERENMWKNNEDVPDGFRALMTRLEGWIKFLSKAQKKTFSNKWFTTNRITFVMMILRELEHLNLKINKDKKWDDFYEGLLNYIVTSSTSKHIYGYTDSTDLTWIQLIAGLNYSAKVYNDKDCTIPNGSEQYEIMRNVFTEEFIWDMVNKNILVEVKKRKNFSLMKILSLFIGCGQLVRVNGLVRRKDGSEEWFNPNSKDKLYEYYTILKFIQSHTDVDHIKSLRGGNSNDDDNLELTTSEFNKFKSSSELIK